MTAPPMSAVVAAIRATRFRYATEDDLQEGLYRLLRAEGFCPKREVRLSGRDRVDLLVGRVAIEVKVDGGAAALARQLARYATSGQIDALLVVTNRVGHLAMPDQLEGKPVEVLNLVGPLA